jgi:hypothetical protein
MGLKSRIYNQLDGDPMIKIKIFAFYMVSGSSPVVAHMMATGSLHGR